MAEASGAPQDDINKALEAGGVDGSAAETAQNVTPAPGVPEGGSGAPAEGRVDFGEL